MKVLIYTHSFAPHIGGLETIVMSLAEGLAQLCPDGAGTTLKVTVATATAAGKMDDAGLPFRVVRQPTSARLVTLLREADVIHLAGPALLPLFLGWLMRKRMVVEHHGFQTACPNGQLFHEPSQATCPGHFMAEHHLECLRCNARLGGIESLKMWLLTFPRRYLCEVVSSNVTPTVWLSTVLRLPRTTTIVHGVCLPVRHQPTQDFASPPTFVFLGRLVSTKGAEILLAAADKLKDQGYAFRVKIVGDGPDRDLLRKRASRAGLEGWIEFLGYLSDEGVEKVIAGAVAVVMPSVAGEVFGLVAAENMLRGKLVIASDIGALREIVGDAGMLFPPGDDVGLASCMRMVLENVPGAIALGEKASQRATRLFDEKIMLRRHFSLYGRLASCEK